MPGMRPDARGMRMAKPRDRRAFSDEVLDAPLVDLLIAEERAIDGSVVLLKDENEESRVQVVRKATCQYPGQANGTKVDLSGDNVANGRVLDERRCTCGPGYQGYAFAERVGIALVFRGRMAGYSDSVAGLKGLRDDVGT